MREDQVSQGKLKDYSACQGSWRPDFLIEERAGRQDEAAVENFLITEINGRFAFNGALHLAYGQEALDDMNLEEFKLTSTTTPALVSLKLLHMIPLSLRLDLRIDRYSIVCVLSSILAYPCIYSWGRKQG